jgi:membrane protease YdiL (CAAX protease family)
MKKHPIPWFYVLAFVISWLGWLPMVARSRGIAPFDHPLFQFLLLLPAIGPVLAAVIVTTAIDGKASIKRLLKPLLQWQVGAVWLMTTVLVPALLLVAGKIVTQALGLAATTESQGNNIVGMAIATLVMSLFSNTWEEVGWRGFALPRLQKDHNALVATLVVGVLWGLWHLPLFFWKDNPMSNYPFLAWFIGTVAVSFVYTWLYNSTQASLFVVTLFHVLGNTFGVVISGVSVTALAIVDGVIAALLVAVLGKDNLARRERVCAG